MTTIVTYTTCYIDLLQLGLHPVAVVLTLYKKARTEINTRFTANMVTSTAVLNFPAEYGSNFHAEYSSNF
jgi:hypothetical protein